MAALLTRVSLRASSRRSMPWSSNQPAPLAPLGLHTTSRRHSLAPDGLVGVAALAVQPGPSRVLWRSHARLFLRVEAPW
jgi:hypothetical protein